MAAFAVPAVAATRAPPSARISFRPSLHSSLLQRHRLLLSPSLAGLPVYGPVRAPLLALSGAPPYDGGRGGAFPRGRDDDGDDGDAFEPLKSLSALSAFLGTLLARYSRLLIVAPVRTKAMTSGFLMLLSDYLAQVLTQPVLEAARLARFLVYGVLVAGPATHAWYAVLDRVVRFGGLRAAVAKTALDQLLMSHFFIFAFFAFMHLAEGRELGAMRTMLGREHVPAFLASLKVWPLVNMVNFSLVPPAYRVVFGSAVNVGWITFLSMTAAAAPKAGDGVEVAVAGS